MSEKKELEFIEQCTGAYKGQVNCVIGMFKGEEYLGRLDFAIFQEKPHINYIEIEPTYREKGYGCKLIEHFVKDNNYDYDDLGWGMLTESGAKLKEKCDLLFRG